VQIGAQLRGAAEQEPRTQMLQLDLHTLFIADAQLTMGCPCDCDIMLDTVMTGKSVDQMH
jgi:hypothetical protein